MEKVQILTDALLVNKKLYVGGAQVPRIDSTLHSFFNKFYHIQKETVVVTTQGVLMETSSSAFGSGLTIR